MRYDTIRAHLVGTAAALALATVTLSGCGQTSQGTVDTMTLLHSGSEKVCIAPDVQDTLRRMIMPKAGDLAGDGTLEDKQAALSSVPLSFELTTLQSFDKVVSRAVCNTTLHISPAGGQPVKLPLNFTVSPSAENAGTFVIMADVDEAHAETRLLVAAELQDAITKRANADQQRQEQQARQQLLAQINEKWLTGVWITTEQSPETCASDSAIRFMPGHVLSGEIGDGRWSLQEDRLHVIVADHGGSVERTYTLGAADAVSFSASLPADDPGNLSLRRCTRAEINAQPGPSDVQPEAAVQQ